MSISIEKAGVFDTIQDLGRVGFRKFGVNTNGVMDQTSLRILNILLGNDENAGAIEFHFPAPLIRFESDAIFAIGGAYFDAELSGSSIENWRSYRAKAGDLLKFRRRLAGSRGYFGVCGGFAIEPWLGSQSTNVLAEVGGLSGRALRKGDQINLNESSPNHPLGKIARSMQPGIHDIPVIRIIAGPEFHRLTALSEQSFFEGKYKISNNSNRMGFRLDGNPLYMLNDAQIVSSGVTFGTVQVLSSGQPVILMADHQTTGGYPRIGSVIKPDLAKLAQLDTRDEVRFQAISITDAEQIQSEFERDLNFLKMGMRFKLKQIHAYD